MNSRRLLTLFLSLMLGACGWFSPDLPEPEDGFRHLFNGRNLDGWQVIGGDAQFRVEDGEIVGRVGPGPNTFLRTEEVFGDFILTLEVKFDEPGNSGVLFRAKARPEGHPDEGRAYGYQYELDPSERSWSGGLYDEARRGWLVSLQNNEAARKLLKPDDWNRVKIEARGVQLQTWLNGEPVAALADGLDLRGFIALQVHAGNEGLIRWRNIQIQALGETRYSADSIRDPAFWESRHGGGMVATDKGLAINGAIRSRRQLGNFALRFNPTDCPQPVTITLRHQEDGSSREGVQLTLLPGKASLQSLPSGPAENLAWQAQQAITIAAAGDSLSIAIGEQGFTPLAGLPERGWISIDSGTCTPLELQQLEWIDGRSKKSEPDFYETLDTPPAPVLSPEQALDSFRIAPGFRIELVAEEPMVQDPVAMAWDESGRLFVVEMRGFMPDAYGSGEDQPVGRVVMLEDTDGDGRMDERSIFMDGLVMPRAVAVVNEGLLVAEPPTLWLCPDIAGKHHCDKRRKVGDYATDYQQASMEHLENGLMRGLDNWLYNAKSERRMKLVDGELVVEPTLARGQWGISMDDAGRFFYNTNSNFLSGDFYPAEGILTPGEDTLYPGLTELISTDDEVFSIRVNPGVNRAYIDGTLKPDGRLDAPTAVSGLAVYRGDQFPPAFAGDVFVPEPAANVIAQLRLQGDVELSARHITYPDNDWGQREFLASTDERFRPVDVRSGPDGALYVIDMYRGIIQHKDFLTEELREQIFDRDLDKPINYGRIWRIIAENQPAPKFQPLNPGNTTALIAALDHDNGWVRDTAQRLLVGSRSTATDLKLRAAVANGSPRHAVHALWTLQGRDTLGANTVISAISRGQAELSLQALRAGGDKLRLKHLLVYGEQWQTAGVALRQQWLLSLQAHNTSSAVQSVLADTLAENADNPYLRIAALHAARGAEAPVLMRLLSNEAAASEGVNDSLRTLTRRHYLELRAKGDIPQLNSLLEHIASQHGDLEGRQLALLAGLADAAKTPGFEPWELSAAPALFTDTSIDERSPLWKARLAARRALTWPGDELAAGIEPLGPRQMALMQKGEAFYAACAGCHGTKGEGTKGLAPPLAASEWVTGAPEWLARIILDGMSGPVTVLGIEWNNVMPGHRNHPGLDDDTLAGLMTYLRRSWGNTAAPVDPETAAEYRRDSAGRNQPWTVPDLEQVPVATGLEALVGKYKVSFVTFTVTQEDGVLHLAVPMYGGGPMEALGDGRFAAAAGGESIVLEFPVDENGQVPHALLHREGSTIELKRVD